MASVHNDPKLLFPRFREKAERIVRLMNEHSKAIGSNVKYKFGETARGAGRQACLFAQGRTAVGPVVTYDDGVHHLSRHQFFMAFDLFPYTEEAKKQAAAYEEADWAMYGHFIRAEGLVWGGDWNGNGRSDDERFVDKPHCEWPHKDHDAYREAAKWGENLRL